MRKTISLIIALIFLGGAVAFFSARAISYRARALEGDGLRRESVVSRSLTADGQIAAAQKLVANEPSNPKGYNLLAAALMQKARETGDFNINKKAEEALTRSLAAAPDNYDALKLRAKLLLTFHRFAEALEVARHAQSLDPQDHDNYGAMTDALVELGEYAAAVDAAQKMVDLRPDTASYSRVSYLRQLHGDVPGAVEALQMAVQSANPQNPESVAWCLVQLGDALLLLGKPTQAEIEFDRALFHFPEYHAALAAKGRARLAANDLAGAISFYERAVRRVPLPEYAAALGDLYSRAGRAEDAQRQYTLVEFVERAGDTISKTYSRELALFWADHDRRLDDALDAARRERTQRNDIYTNDVLAWCLYKKGQTAEAKKAMAEAMRLGTRDPRLLYHAGMIAQATGDSRAASKYLKAAVALAPAFNILQAEVARRMLATIRV